MSVRRHPPLFFQAVERAGVSLEATAAMIELREAYRDAFERRLALGKFFEIDGVGDEPAVPYAELVRVLRDIG